MAKIGTNYIFWGRYMSYFYCPCLLFSRSDWHHKLCRDFVVLAVPMTLAVFPPYAKGMLSVHWKSMSTFVKSHNFSRYMLTCMHFWSVSYKKNDVVFGQKSQIENVPCTNPIGIRECCPLFQCRGWGKRSDGIAPDRKNIPIGSGMSIAISPSVCPCSDIPP